MKLNKIITFIFLFIFTFQNAFAIRIGLDEDISKTYIGSSQNAQFIDANTGNLLFVSRSFFPYSIKAWKDSIAIKVKGRYYDCSTNILFVKNPKRKGDKDDPEH